MEGLLLFAALLAGFGFVAFRPEWRSAYLAFFVFMRFSDVLRTEFGVPSLFMVVGPGLVGVALAHWLFTGERAGRGWRPALWMMVAYGAVCLASLMYADDVERTHARLLNYVDGIVIVLAASAFLRTVEDLRRAVWAMLAAGGLLASLAVFQQLSGSFEQDFLGFSRVEMRNIYDDSAGFRSEGPVSANYFALILIALVPLAVDRLVHGSGTRLRALAGAILFVVLGAIVFTYSRGGLVALAAVAVAMLVWVPRRRIGRVLFATGLPVALAVAFVLPAEYVQRVTALGQVVGIGGGNAPQDSALSGRLSEMTSAAMMFADHPAVGVGYGNFELHYPRYAQTIGLDARREERQAHSLYLEVAAETGLVGLTAFLLLLGLALGNVQRARRSLAASGRRDTAHLATALGIGLLGYLAGSVFLHLAFPRYFWLLIGLAYGCRELALQCEEEDGSGEILLTEELDPVPPDPGGAASANLVKEWA